MMLSQNNNSDKSNLTKSIYNTAITKSFYITNINAKRNPDILTGLKNKFIAGDKYYGFIKEIKDPDDGECSNQDPASESDSESIHEFNEVPLRYYHTENKTVRCINCREIGHMARACPN